MLAWKIAPALAAGCTIVFKPAELTPLSALKIASLFPKAGYPSGVFNVVNGLGPSTGAYIASHPDIDKIAFTGSTIVGREIIRMSQESNLKKVSPKSLLIFAQFSFSTSKKAVTRKFSPGTKR